MKLSRREISSFLMYRMINPENTNSISNYFPKRKAITNSCELEEYIEDRLSCTNNRDTAIALSGGIDSAVLAKFMPKGSRAYTFKCIVPGVDVVDETKIAAKYAEECGLEHRIIEVYWEDFEKYAEGLMRKKQSPIHSIEIQIYKAALQARDEGIKELVFGEAADAVYGGQSNILSRDWTIGEFIERFSYLMPYRVLKDFEIPVDIIKQYENNGFVDPYTFMSNVYIQESVSSYINPTEAAGIKVCMPYAETFLDTAIDYTRIRNGENKYLVRELFKRLYPNFDIPAKIPMPRPMNEWLNEWCGPEGGEFWPNCTRNLSGDQKWQIWALDRYLRI